MIDHLSLEGLNRTIKAFRLSSRRHSYLGARLYAMAAATVSHYHITCNICSS